MKGICFFIILLFGCTECINDFPTSENNNLLQKLSEYQNQTVHNVQLLVPEDNTSIFWYYNKSTIFCINNKSKTMAWETDLPTALTGKEHDIYKDKGIAFITEAGQYLMVFNNYDTAYSLSTCLTFKLNKTTGRIIKKYDIEYEKFLSTRGNIVYEDGFFYFSSYSIIYKLSIESSCMEWATDLDFIGCSDYQIEIYSDKLFVKSPKKIYCLDISSGEILWNFIDEGSRHNFILYENEIIYLTSRYNEPFFDWSFNARDIHTGKLLWSQAFTSLEHYEFQIDSFRLIKPATAYLGVTNDYRFQILFLFDLHKKEIISTQEIPYIEYQLTQSGATIYEPNFKNNPISNYLKELTDCGEENTIDETIPAELWWQIHSGANIPEKYFRFRYPYRFNLNPPILVKGKTILLLISFSRLPEPFSIKPDIDNEEKLVLLLVNSQNGQVLDHIDLNTQMDYSNISISTDSLFLVTQDKKIIIYELKN